MYAIGDIHGRYDLFQQLIADIAVDNSLRRTVPTGLVLLGDMIDRGPDSRKLIHGCMALARRSDRFVVLKGNHEWMMVEALTGDPRTLSPWLRMGGRETLLSWGIDAALLDEGDAFDITTEARAAVGDEVLEWLDALPLTFRHRNYLFVHAGMRGGRRIEDQTEEDLLWIRDEFTGGDDDFGCIVVHGHTIFEGAPDITERRVGIDTGAYYTGQLTAVGLEHGEGWVLSTEPDHTASAARGAKAERLALVG